MTWTLEGIGPPPGGRGGPTRLAGSQSSSLLASVTASVKACCTGTFPNRAFSTAVRTTAFTSPLLGMVGTMSAYFEIAASAEPRALSSMSGELELKYGSSKALADEG